jgi:adenylate kinase family enzyme
VNLRIAITGPSGSGKTTLAVELARRLDLRHVEIDALHHGPNWESCGEEVLRERVLAATEGDGWVTDSLYHHMLGDLIADRSDLIVWLDLPVALVMWRLLRRSYLRKRNGTVLWNGNVEPSWTEQAYYLFWPALQRAFENRRRFPTRFAHKNLRRLRSDAEVMAFLQSIQPTASTSGSSSSSARQNTPPVVET